jgi:hypothetical protein
MALTNAEKQQKYRERALKNPSGHNLTRLQALIDSHAAACLERMAKNTGKTKKELIEQALVELADKLGYKYGD